MRQILLFFMIFSYAQTGWGSSAINRKSGIISKEKQISEFINDAEAKLSRASNNPNTHYALGILYCLAISKGIEKSEVLTLQDIDIRSIYTTLVQGIFEKSKYFPVVISPGPYISLEHKIPNNMSPKDMKYFQKSIFHYQKAIYWNDKSNRMYWLGLGWMLENGSTISDKMNAPFIKKKRRASQKEWEDAALKAYRRIAGELSPFEVLKEQRLGEIRPSVLAGKSVLRILDKRKQTQIEREEANHIRSILETEKKEVK